MISFDSVVNDLAGRGWSHQKDCLSQLELEKIQLLFNEGFTPAHIGHSHKKKRDEEIRGDLTRWIDPLNPWPNMEPILNILNGLMPVLNRHFFLGLKQFECHLAKYPVGSFYKKHQDRFEKDSSRSLSFIFYLNQSWDSKDGGELILYDKENKTLQEISPQPGSFVCFLSDDFPHEVRPAKKERRSLTGWMHTKLIY